MIFDLNFLKQVLLKGVEMFHGPESPGTLQVIQVGKHAMGVSGLLVDRYIGYEQKI